MNSTKMVEFGEVTMSMSSLDLLDVINNVRIEFNEPEVENSHFLKRVEDELEGELGLRKVFVNPAGGRPKDYYDLTLEQCTLVGMRESKGVRRAVFGKLKELENKIIQPKVSENYIKDLVESEVKKQLAKKPASRKKKKIDAKDFPDSVIAANEALASKGDGIPIWDFVSKLGYAFPGNRVYLGMKEMGLIVGKLGFPSEYCILQGWMYFAPNKIWLGLGKGSIEHTSVFITPKGREYIVDRLKKELF